MVRRPTRWTRLSTRWPDGAGSESSSRRSTPYGRPTSCSAPLARVYVGLNDLMIDRGCGPSVRGPGRRHRRPGGRAGRGRRHPLRGGGARPCPRAGDPVPCRLLAGELARGRRRSRSCAGRSTPTPPAVTSRWRRPHPGHGGRGPRRDLPGCRSTGPAWCGGRRPARGRGGVKALVTGVGGFVGAHLAARLVADGWDVAGTARPEAHPGGSRRSAAHAVDVAEADLSNRGAAAAIVAAGGAGPDVGLPAGGRPAGEVPPCPPNGPPPPPSTGPAWLWLVDALPHRCHTVVQAGIVHRVRPGGRPHWTKPRRCGPEASSALTKATGPPAGGGRRRWPGNAVGGAARRSRSTAPSTIPRPGWVPQRRRAAR